MRRREFLQAGALAGVAAGVPGCAAFDLRGPSDLFVPQEYSVMRDDLSENREAGLLYCFKTTHLFAFGFANLLKKRAHLWEGISPVLHRCGE